MKNDKEQKYNMKILELTLKKQWYDMILSGEKKEEYREIKEYWATRFLYKIPVPWGGNFTPMNDLLNGDFEFKGWEKFTGGAPVFKKFDIIRFRNGYGSQAPSFLIEVKELKISKGKTEWGAEPGEIYFTFILGDFIQVLNLDDENFNSEY